MNQDKNQHEYHVTAWWTSGRSGLAKSDTAPNAIHFSAPPDGLEGNWTAVELLLASISGCFTTTFRTVASRSACEFTDLEVTANATIHNVSSSSYFDDIEVRPTVKITNIEECDRVLGLLEKAERLCLVARALRFPVKFESQVQVIETGQPLLSDA
ncbi:MAG TPA: OsmC family protein [Terriglobales bacterium]|nr:OsmC family protein [Terriglobales bacterium]